MSNRSLPPEDYNFILASQALKANEQVQKVEDKRQEVEERRQELAKSNQRLGGRIGGWRAQQKKARERLLEKELAVAEKEAAAEQTLQEGLKKQAEAVKQLKKIAEKEAAAEQTLQEGLKKQAEAVKQLQRAKEIALSAQQFQTTPYQNGSNIDIYIGFVTLVGIISLVNLLLRFVTWIL